MPLRSDLLNPIPGASPTGADLRYAPLYDKIKEARREEDDVPQGDWQRERKVADYALVAKLAGEVLATKSKDLQVAVWLSEALLKTEGFAGFREGLSLIQSLIETYWDGLYPELEDGDAEMRAVPLDWMGSRLAGPIRNVGLTRNGLSWFKFKEGRATGYEADANTEARTAAREAAIADGKLTPEEWDQAYAATSREFYAATEADLDRILEAIESLNALCEEKFGDVAPSFGPLREAADEVRHTVHSLLQKKDQAVPPKASATPPPAENEATSTSSDDGWSTSSDDGWSTSSEEAEITEPAAEPAAEENIADASSAEPHAETGLPAEPVDREDACRRIGAAAHYLRHGDPSSPAPYLVLRGLRWGELSASGNGVDPLTLEAPPTEVRQSLKRCLLESDWAQLREAAEGAAALPCGRGWLDLQRYAVRAATELGYPEVAAAIKSGVRTLLADYPDLAQASLLDDTPAANPETQAWLREIGLRSGILPRPAVPREPEPEPAPPAAAGTAQPLDPHELALQAANEGRPENAIEILTEAAGRESSGRGRFQRRMQLAGICVLAGCERIARPILEQLVDEIDKRDLESWEAPALVARTLALYYGCIGAEDPRRAAIYDRLCRLDPLHALSCGR